MAVLSTPNGLITDDGGDTDLRSEAAMEAAVETAALLLEVMFELELIRDRGSLTLVAGRDPRGGSWAGTLVGGALIPPPPPVGPPTEADVEARITAAAALGAVRLLSGTKGV